MNLDFEIVPSRRTNSMTDKRDAAIPLDSLNNSRIGDAIADNFAQIVDIASNIVEIEKMKFQSEAVLRQMEESRKNLLAEAEAYVARKNAETDSVIRKMQIIKDMMRDFYQYNDKGKLSGEDFSRIIKSICDEMEQL